MTVKPPFNLMTRERPSPLASSMQSAEIRSSSSGSQSSTMTRAAFETLEMQELIDYLIVQGVKLEEEDIAIFKKQRITGAALVLLSQEALERYGLPGGLAVKILKRIPKENTPSFPQKRAGLVKDALRIMSTSRTTFYSQWDDPELEEQGRRLQDKDKQLEEKDRPLEEQATEDKVKGIATFLSLWNEPANVLPYITSLKDVNTLRYHLHSPNLFFSAFIFPPPQVTGVSPHR